MIDHIRALALFAKAAEAGSFRGAAKMVGVSPSVVSEQVRNLEAHLGVALIYRSTRQFSLTPDGIELLQSAQEMVQTVENGFAQFISKSIQPVGELRLSIPSALSDSAICTDLAEFAKEYLSIALRINFSDEQQDIIRDGYDMAIRVGWLKDSSLKAKKLSDIRRLVVASPEYIAKHPKLNAPQDLKDWDFIHLTSLPEKISFKHAQKGDVQVKGKSQISVDDASAMREFAVAGCGVAVSLEFKIREDITQGRLVEILPDWTVEAAGAYAVWPANAPRNGLVRLLVKYLEGRKTLY
ncbi:LysR family transcriptional regulator [Amylibacter sp. SFDW26]|uniref:LysR family transcriptional regulator n=1 Tax=Amylibacter sp. SFDW26 TaxID=2652722 RepID=UPI0012629B69|nr:LysR family transcriptional regulator [Amylibacter sp. SFDW26]KAB7613686.1 LysR family transcriptional regulator [Amylibacter sp. SFDW26]